MTMTKKDFNVIADVIKKHFDWNFNHGVHTNQRDFLSDLIDYFNRGNPKFDRDKFIKACGL